MSRPDMNGVAGCQPRKTDDDYNNSWANHICTNAHIYQQQLGVGNGHRTYLGLFPVPSEARVIVSADFHARAEVSREAHAVAEAEVAVGAVPVARRVAVAPSWDQQTVPELGLAGTHLHLHTLFTRCTAQRWQKKKSRSQNMGRGKTICRKECQDLSICEPERELAT